MTKHLIPLLIYIGLLFVIIGVFETFWEMKYPDTSIEGLPIPMTFNGVFGAIGAVLAATFNILTKPANSRSFGKHLLVVIVIALGICLVIYPVFFWGFAFSFWLLPESRLIIHYSPI